MSRADEILKSNIREILTSGFSDEGENVRPRWADGTPAHTVKAFGLTNRYDIEKEFPLITLRQTRLSLALDELLWIWQKKSNNIADLNSKIWNSWADKGGSIGKAYGYQLGIKHKYSDGEFDQVDRVLHDLKQSKNSRRMIVNMFNHADLHAMNLYPCAYSMTFNVTGERLNGILNQRSQDMITANNWNVAQYAALICMLAQVSGLRAGELVHVIADAHIYDRHIPLAKRMLDLPVFDAPQLKINEKIKNFYDFRVEDFEVINYKYNEINQRIEVAI